MAKLLGALIDAVEALFPEPADVIPFTTARCEICRSPVREGMRYCTGLSRCFRVGETAF